MKNIPQPLATELEIIALEMEIDAKSHSVAALRAFLQNDSEARNWSKGMSAAYEECAQMIREVLK